MSDPVYEYVRGEGWVLNGTATFVVERFYDGRTYRLTIEKRHPKKGEHGWYFPITEYPNIQNAEIDKTFGGFGWYADGKEPDYPGEVLCTIITEL